MTGNRYWAMIFKIVMSDPIYVRPMVNRATTDSTDTFNFTMKMMPVTIPPVRPNKRIMKVRNKTILNHRVADQVLPSLLPEILF